MKLSQTTALFLAIANHQAYGHLPLGFEPERIRQVIQHPSDSFAYNNRDEEDFSLSKPFDIVANLYEGLPDFEKSSRLPTSSFFVNVRLNGESDVDYLLYNMSHPDLASYTPTKEDDPPSDVYDFVFYAIAPFCKRYEDFHPSIAMMGPLDTLDVNGEAIFQEPTGTEAFEIPDGYGVIVKQGRQQLEDGFLVNQSQGIEGDEEHRRPTYSETIYSHSKWFLPLGYSEDCIEDYSNIACMASPEVITVRGIPYDPTSGPFYFAVWSDDDSMDEPFVDIDVVVGTKDKYLVSDFVRIGSVLPFVARGRNLGTECKVPYKEDATADSKEEGFLSGNDNRDPASFAVSLPHVAFTMIMSGLITALWLTN